MKLLLAISLLWVAPMSPAAPPAFVEAEDLKKAFDAGKGAEYQGKSFGIRGKVTKIEKGALETKVVKVILDPGIVCEIDLGKYVSLQRYEHLIFSGDQIFVGYQNHYPNVYRQIGREEKSRELFAKGSEVRLHGTCAGVGKSGFVSGIVMKDCR